MVLYTPRAVIEFSVTCSLDRHQETNLFLILAGKLYQQKSNLFTHNIKGPWVMCMCAEGMSLKFEVGCHGYLACISCRTWLHQMKGTFLHLSIFDELDIICNYLKFNLYLKTVPQ